MAEYDPTNNDQPSDSVLGANPRYVLVPLGALLIASLFFGIAWINGNFDTQLPSVSYITISSHK